ncbi:hypothetical protein Tco_1414481 [Tanacetum coccineum]
MRRANTFVPMETEIRRGVPELVADSSQAAITESTKAGGTKRAAEEELVLEQGMNVEALQTKYPIIDWEIYIEGTRKYWKIMRVGNHTEVYQFLDDLLKVFDRDDLVKLWNGELWKLQQHIHDLTWKLYDSCGVHHVSTEKGIDIYMLVEKEYLLSKGTLTLMLVAKLLVDQDNEMSR